MSDNKSAQLSYFEKILLKYEQQSVTNREKGTYFEKLVIDFLLNDKVFSTQYSNVQTYADFAKQQGISAIDTGIDLVATNMNKVDDKGQPTYTAIQCKNVASALKISKAEIDSFMGASDRDYVTNRIIFDTSIRGINSLALDQLIKSTRPFERISLTQFEQSSIDWQVYFESKQQRVVQQAKKQLRPHQSQALNNTVDGFKTADRGKLIMACGTGKTFTALKIAENMAGAKSQVLFVVPSLSLMSQTITEWLNNTDTAISAFCVCSDQTAGKRKSDDNADIDSHDLSIPPTTKANKLAKAVISCKKDSMVVVFATYQSIDVIENAQSKYHLPAFDLIICDEAHRTTGATLANDKDSNFVKVHDNQYVKGNKRLYMTATPRIYTDNAKSKAKSENTTAYSMDDEELFGKEFYSLPFGVAVEQGLLSDYRVIILGIDQNKIAVDLRKFLEQHPEIELSDATKMIGCYQALLKTNIDDKKPMSRVVAFCSNIEKSKLFEKSFVNVLENYILANADSDIETLDCEVKHVDGKMAADDRQDALKWLKEEQSDQCRILSNVRCLSEGVDVPSLDAVMFIHGKKSKVDIVQSVGRVMRKANNKYMGYVIIPFIKPSNVDESEALSKSVNYQVIWDIVNALRSHDDRLDSIINQMSLTDNEKEKLVILSKKIEVVVSVDQLPTAQKKSIGIGNSSNTTDDTKQEQIQQGVLDFQIEPVTKAIMAQLVTRCGRRDYWQDWAKDVSVIAQAHIARIKATVSDKASNEYKVFAEFVEQLQNNLNNSIKDDEVVEMLAQHIITKPVFNALFADYDFAKHNAVSKSMQSVLDILDKTNLEAEQHKLDKFYASVHLRAKDIATAEMRQKVIIELYDKFFKSAFPRLSERLGIVYTPVECVDFIIHSVNDVLKQEFGQTLGDKNTHIIDPFTGTGTFITRLMQSGLLTKEQIEYKYNLHDKKVKNNDGEFEIIKTTEIHANEVVLLAYYIASINIESVYHSIVGGEYKSFNGICLTDTFQLNEQQEDLITPQLEDNNHRRKIQQKLPIRVIVGNPPYSAKQKSGNDNNQNLKYEKLDNSISNTYEKFGTSTNNNSLYDSYIRAIRWASNRIDKYGVIGFITNASWLESNSADGVRKCLKDEFSSIYVFNLRGAIRGKSGDDAKKEGQNVFDIMTGVAITIFIKNDDAKDQGKIYYYDIGDYLLREDKLAKITFLGSIVNITNSHSWQEIISDKYNDWITKRDDSFYEHIAIGDKKNKNDTAIFENYSRGLETGRDAWVYNYSKSKLIANVSGMIDFYNSELDRYKNEALKNQPTNKSNLQKYVTGFINKDSKKFSWTSSLIPNKIVNNITTDYSEQKVIQATYRPFSKCWCYFDEIMNHRTGQMPKIYPEADIENVIIGCSGKGASVFSVIISNNIVDLNLLEAGCQCFPLYLYEPLLDKKQQNNDLFISDEYEVIITAPSGKKYIRRHAINDTGLKHFTDYYQDKTISKHDLFYYIYGLLHNEQYKTKYANNLTKSLPHIPRVKTIADFKQYSQAGRQLADLHINYEQQPTYNKVQFNQDINTLSDTDFGVVKMKFKDKKDKSTIIYNSKITISNIPVRAYNYVINGKSAIEWVMERQSITTHKDSGITNNANDWAIETMNNPKYPLELLLKIITVSLKTLDIIVYNISSSETVFIIPNW